MTVILYSIESRIKINYVFESLIVLALTEKKRNTKNTKKKTKRKSKKKKPQQFLVKKRKMCSRKFFFFYSRQNSLACVVDDDDCEWPLADLRDRNICRINKRSQVNFISCQHVGRFSHSSFIIVRLPSRIKEEKKMAGEVKEKKKKKRERF